MKCVAILSSLPDIIFFHCDDEYKKMIAAFAAERGLPEVRARIATEKVLRRGTTGGP